MISKVERIQLHMATEAILQELAVVEMVEMIVEHYVEKILELY